MRAAVKNANPRLHCVMARFPQKLVGVFLLFLITTAFVEYRASAQDFIRRSNDPCGYPDTSSVAYRIAAAQNWGYGYSDLLRDIDDWTKSPFVRSDIIGLSVQNRPLYMLTVTSTVASERKRRVWIHARTHPNEVEGTYVTNEMIRFLLSDQPLARNLRDSCVFTIVPMLNPDGVELKRPRENANGIDIESNWNTIPHQPEVAAIKAQFIQSIQSPSPIRIALNMHSAYDCVRYFVYHAAGGTSVSYTVLEQRFIAQTQSRFPGGFKNWDYFVSWVNGTALQYPESWFWQNHREAVLALTYEDMNCPAHGEYDRTARAILGAIGEFLLVATDPLALDFPPMESTATLNQNYPNPFSNRTTISYSIGLTGGSNGGGTSFSIEIFDPLGRSIKTLRSGKAIQGNGSVEFQTTDLKAGFYLCVLRVGGQAFTRKMLVSK